jgi:hypothetical protein
VTDVLEVEPERFPALLGVSCDSPDCEVVWEGDFVVAAADSSAVRFGYVRAHVAAREGWRCDRTGDWCPTHARSGAEPGRSGTEPARPVRDGG